MYADDHTVNGVLHHAGEISATGRGGSGKSYKMWRSGTFITDPSYGNNDYIGVLYRDDMPSTSNAYFRFYVRFSTNLDLYSTDGSKMFRLNTTSPAAAEIYFNLRSNTGQLRDSGFLAIASTTVGWTQLMSHADLMTNMDGNWHCWEFHIDLNNRLAEFWSDGVQKAQITNWSGISSGTITRIQHFALGNTNSQGVSAHWQSDWGYVEVDDMVYSTTYVGPDGTSYPNISNVNPSIVSTGQTVTITGTSLVNEDITGWNTMFKSGTVPSAAYGFEGSNPSSDGYTIPASNNTAPTYVTTKKLSGAKSLKAHIAGVAGGPSSYVSVPSGVVPPATGDRWVRAYVYFDLLGGTLPTNYQRLFSSTTTGTYHFGTSGTSNWIETWPVSGTPTDVTHSMADGTLQLGKWYLVELHWKNSTSPTYEVYVDNAFVGTSGTNMSASQITDILFPLVSWSGTTSAFSEDVYVDNFAISTARIKPSALIEISNNVNYHQGTVVYQEPLFISDSSIQFKANIPASLGGSGQYYLWVTNNKGQYYGPVNITGSPGGDTTSPVTTAAPVAGPYGASQTITFNCSDNVSCASTQYCWGVGCTPNLTYSTPLTIQAGTLGYRSTDSSSNLETTKYSAYTVATDTTPPVLSQLLPYGTLAFGTTSTTLSVTTDESATCKYSSTNVSYASMASTMTGTGTAHTATISGLTGGSSYTRYVACQNLASLTSANSAISFNVSNVAPSNSVLFTESFEDSNFTNRGWYDQLLAGDINYADAQAGNSLQWAWDQGATRPNNTGTGGALRKLFTPTDTLYVQFYVKFLTGWQGSGMPYHPHLVYILSDVDVALDGASGPLANSYLQTYIEMISNETAPYAIVPVMAIQDEKRVNVSYGAPSGGPPQHIDISALTENRSVGYCNSPNQAGASGICYADNPWYSGNTWASPSNTISINAWHKIGVYLQMNTIVGGVGQSNGKMQYWVDDVLAIDRNDVMYRTNQDATKKWQEFILGPYIGPGAPVAETVLIDELTVATTKDFNYVPPSGYVSFDHPIQVYVGETQQVSVMK